MDHLPYLCDKETGACTHACDEGHACLGSVNASRRIFGLPPLDPDTTPMHPIRMTGGDELADTSAESVKAGRAVGAWLVAIFCACALATAWAHALSS